MTKPRSGHLSIIPSAAVFDHRLCRTDLAVLCALGAHADRIGRCWPATTTLANDIRVTTRQVRRCLRNLENCDHLKTEHRPGQRSVYVINRKGADPGHPGSGVPRTYSDTTPDTQVPGLDVDPGHPGSAPRTPRFRGPRTPRFRQTESLTEPLNGNIRVFRFPTSNFGPFGVPILPGDLTQIQRSRRTQNSTRR